MTTSTILPELPTSGVTILPETSWAFYEQFLEEYNERRIPHSYVNGELRITSPSFRHETSKRRITRLIDVLTEELDIPRRSLGSVLLRSAFKEKGAEPDEGYMLANEAALRGRLDYDPETDPPPDLLIEIDITSPSLNRLAVYAALGVPEVWVYDGRALHVKLLQKDETYRESESSAAFPFLPMAEFQGWIEKAFEADETTWIRSFREWVRARLKPQA